MADSWCNILCSLSDTKAILLISKHIEKATWAPVLQHEHVHSRCVLWLITTGWKVSWMADWAALYVMLAREIQDACSARRPSVVLAAPPGISMMMTIMQRERRGEKKSAKGNAKFRSPIHTFRGSQSEYLEAVCRERTSRQPLSFPDADYNFTRI